MSSVNRVSGLASGIDYESIIKQMMAVRRAPLDKIEQQTQKLQWQVDDYRTLNNKILDFRNTAFDMKLKSNYSITKVASSNDSIISASPTGSAVEGVYDLEVKSLASGSRLTSMPLGATKGLSSTIGDVRGSSSTDTTQLRIAGEKGTAVLELKNTDSVASFIAQVNEQATNTGVRVTYDSTMDRFFFSSTNTGAKAKVELSATVKETGASDTGFINNFLHVDTSTNPITSTVGEQLTGAAFMTPEPDLDKVIDSTLSGPQVFQINYKGKDYQFAIDKTTTIGTLVNSINSSGLKGAGVAVGLDGDKGTLEFVGLEKGQTVSFSDQTSDSENIVTKLGLPADSAGATSVSSTTAYMTDRPDVNKKIIPSLTGTKTLKMTYDGKDYSFDVNNSTSLQDFMNQINSSDLGKLGVNARMDKTTGALIFTSPDNTKHLGFDDVNNGTSAGIVTALGVQKDVNGVYDGVDFNYDKVVDASGSDAEIKFNGVTAFYSSNTMNIAGINFTAKSAAVGTKVNVTVTQDVDAVYDKIKAFVDKYNDLISAVNAKTNEKFDRNYQPLTDSQKSSMEQEQIDKWEAQAKTGLLYRDPMLNGGLLRFRQVFSNDVSSISGTQFNNLRKIGISNTLITGNSISGDSADNGKLYIDESKLKAAIAANPDEVMKLFTNDDGDSTTSSGDGIAVRLYDQATGLFQQITDKAGVADSSANTYSMGKDMIGLAKEANDWTERLQDIEDQYYKQFTAMETYLNQMNQQSSYIASHLSG